MSHHFRDEGITVSQSEDNQDHWRITFNKEGGAVSIVMDLPKGGVFERSARKVGKPLAERLARMIAAIIRNTLTSDGGRRH